MPSARAWHSAKGIFAEPRIRRSAKRIFFFKFPLCCFKKKFLFAECLHRGTRQRYFKKNCNFFNSSLCRLPKLLGTRQRHLKKLNLYRAPCQGHSAKYFPKKKFAECLTADTRQRRTWSNTVTRGSLCRVPRCCREPGTRQRSSLPSALCRVPGTRQRILC